MAYHWTDDATEIARLAPGADALVIAGCIELADGIERASRSADAQFFSVYLRFPIEWPGDPNGLGGDICIADRHILDDARVYAAALAARFSLPINDLA